MKKALGKVQKGSKTAAKHAKKGWRSEKFLGLFVIGLVIALVGSSILYNIIGKPVQVNTITVARVGLQELVSNLNEVTDIRNSEIGQKDTLPKTVYENLVLLQAESPITPALPSAWATNLFVGEIPELNGSSVSEVYGSLAPTYKAYNDTTYDYLRLIFAMQQRIEYNFLSEFAFTTPELAVYDRKIDAAKEEINKNIETLNNLSISDEATVIMLTQELKSMIIALDAFSESEDIEQARTEIEASQRNIINILADYWDRSSEATFIQINEVNSNLSFIESALK